MRWLLLAFLLSGCVQIRVERAEILPLSVGTSQDTKATTQPKTTTISGPFKVSK